LQQNRKIQELNLLISKTIGFTTFDVFMAIFYANILSGPSTQEVNLLSTAVNTTGEMYSILAQNGNWRQTPQALAAFYQGLGKGTIEALNVLVTGESPTRLDKKFEIPAYFEVIDSDVKFKPIKAYKFVRRALIAGDTFFFKGAEEFKAHMFALQIAKETNLTGEARTRFISDILHNTQEAKTLAQEQAKTEGLHPESRDFKRRVNEIIEQSRPDELRADAFHFASKATFNHETQGALGMIQKQVAAAAEKIPLLKVIVPFTRIVTNVANMSLDYSV